MVSGRFKPEAPGKALHLLSFLLTLLAVVLELVKEDACRRLRSKEPLQ